MSADLRSGRDPRAVALTRVRLPSPNSVQARACRCRRFRRQACSSAEPEASPHGSLGRSRRAARQTTCVDASTSARSPNVGRARRNQQHEWRLGKRRRLAGREAALRDGPENDSQRQQHADERSDRLHRPRKDQTDDRGAQGADQRRGPRMRPDVECRGGKARREPCAKTSAERCLAFRRGLLGIRAIRHRAPSVRGVTGTYPLAMRVMLAAAAFHARRHWRAPARLPVGPECCCSSEAVVS